MTALLVKYTLRLEQKPLAQIIKSSLQAIFPLILLGSFTQIFSAVVFAKEGFINTIFELTKWFPYCQQGQQVTDLLTNFTLGLVALLLAYFVAKNTLIVHQAEPGLAGVTAVLAYFVMTSGNNPSSLFNLRWYGVDKLWLGFLLGWLVGEIFLHLHLGKTADIQAFTALFASLLLALVLHFGIYLLQTFNVIDFDGQILWRYSFHAQFWTVLAYGFLAGLFSWLGLIGSFKTIVLSDSGQNLTYALTHKSYANLPSRFNEYTLYKTYGLIGGIGGVFALLVAIILIARTKKLYQVGLLTMLPTFFGGQLASIVGLPVLLNPIFVIPYLLTPVLNMLIGAGLISSGLLLPTVLPVSYGTPGLLLGFLGSGGDYKMLFAALVIFALDVAIYIPFVQAAEQVSGSENA